MELCTAGFLRRLRIRQVDSRRYMACPRGTRVATIEMKINYLEAVEGGTVTADAEVVRLGRHISVVDCDVRDETGRLVGKALMTFFVGPFQTNRKPRHAKATHALIAGTPTLAMKTRRREILLFVYFLAIRRARSGRSIRRALPLRRP